MISTRCNGTTRRQSLWASRKETRTAYPLTPNSSLVSQKILHAEGKPCSQLYNWDILWTSSSRLCAALARGYATLCAAHRVSMPLCAAFIKVRLSLCATPVGARHYALPFIKGMPVHMRCSPREYAPMRCSSYEYALCAAFIKVCPYSRLTMWVAAMRCLH